MKAESIASEILSSFEGFVEPVYELVYDVDQTLIGSTREADLQLLKERTIEQIGGLISRYREIKIDIKMEQGILDETLSKYAENFSIQLDNLNIAFSQSRPEAANVQELIMDFRLACHAIDIGLKSLWDTAAANLMAYYGDIAGLDAISQLYPMIRAYVYIRGGLIWSVHVNKNKDEAGAISSAYLPSLQKLIKNCEELKRYIQSSGLRTSVDANIDQMYGDLYSKTRKIMELVGNVGNLKISSIDELGSVLRLLWKEMLSTIFTQNRVPPNLQLSELERVLVDANGTVDMDKVLELLESITTNGRDNGLIYSSFHRYRKAADQYELLASAYKLIIDNLRERKSSALYTSLLVASKYWKKQKDECLKEGMRYELEAINRGREEAEASANIGLYFDSIKAINEAIEGKELVDSEVAALLLKKGTLFSQINRPDKALECYQKAERIKPNYLDALYNIGDTFIRLKRYEEAKSLYDKVIELDENDKAGWWGRGLSLHFLGQYTEALNSYDKAINLGQDEHELWFNKGTVYYEMEDYEKAEECYEKAKSINPDSLVNLVNLSEVLLILKKYEKCNKLVKQIRIMPGNEKYRFAITLIMTCSLYLSNNRKEAMTRTELMLNYYESNYYESISTKTNIDVSLTDEWTYKGIKKMIEQGDFPPEEKKFILSLVSLPEAKEAREMIRAVEAVRRSVPQTKARENVKGRILSVVKRGDANETEIKVVNTFSPVKDRESWYDWEIHIEAPKAVLSLIHDVTYILHPTFYQPETKVSEGNGGFMLRASGWGEFKVKAKINLKDGRTITKYHWLNLSDPTLSSRYGHISGR